MAGDLKKSFSVLVTIVPLANAAEKDDAWSTVRNQLGKQGLVPTSYLDLDGNGAA
jgi:hypothetical protein